VIMPERVADAIEEIARPNRDDQQEKPQIQADPAMRRPRLLRNTPVAVLAVLVVAAAVAAGWAVYWALGLPAVSGRPGLSIAGRLPVRVAAAVVVGVVVGGLLAWAFRPSQTLRRGAADVGHRRAASQPADSVDRSAHRGGRTRCRTGRLGDVVDQRRPLRARQRGQRRRRRQSIAARGRGRGDRGRACGAVPAPKGLGASAIRAAIRRGVDAVG
jgi:hypothetical protein